MAALEEAGALRTGEGDDAEPGLEVGTALRGRQFVLQGRELAGGGDRQLGPDQFGAREARLSPSPRIRAAAKRDMSVMVVSIDPAARTLDRSSCGSVDPSIFQPSAMLAAKSGRQIRLVRVMPNGAKVRSRVQSPRSGPGPRSIMNWSRVRPSPE